jgi:hypothetical protein
MKEESWRQIQSAVGTWTYAMSGVRTIYGAVSNPEMRVARLGRWLYVFCKHGRQNKLHSFPARTKREAIRSVSKIMKESEREIRRLSLSLVVPEPHKHIFLSQGWDQ